MQTRLEYLETSSRRPMGPRAQRTESHLVVMAEEARMGRAVQQTKSSAVPKAWAYRNWGGELLVRLRRTGGGRREVALLEMPPP